MRWLRSRVIIEVRSSCIQQALCFPPPALPVDLALACALASALLLPSDLRSGGGSGLQRRTGAAWATCAACFQVHATQLGILYWLYHLRQSKVARGSPPLSGWVLCRIDPTADVTTPGRLRHDLWMNPPTHAWRHSRPSNGNTPSYLLLPWA